MNDGDVLRAQDGPIPPAEDRSHVRSEVTRWVRLFRIGPDERPTAEAMGIVTDLGLGGMGLSVPWTLDVGQRMLIVMKPEAEDRRGVLLAEVRWFAPWSDGWHRCGVRFHAIPSAWRAAAWWPGSRDEAAAA